jgi:hypothetical protein
MAVTEEMLQEVEEITRILRAWDVWDAEKLPMPPCCPDDEKITDTIDALLTEIAALRRALEEHAIHAEYDYPGDAPELCGYTCQICKGFGARNEDVEHETSCVLSSPTPSTGGAHGMD